MKIAIIGTRGLFSRYSGIEVSLAEIARRLSADKEYEITVYCRRTKNDKTKGCVYKNIKPVFLPTVNTKHLNTVIHAFISTLHVLFSDNDIVHFHSLGPSVFSFLPRLFGKKTIVTVHALDWKRKKWGFFARIFLRLCEYPAIFFPHKTVVVSQALKYYFEGKYKKKVYYVPHGSTPQSDGTGDKPRETAPYILFAGRLVPEKGAHYLIRAFNELDTAFKLVIAGEPSFTENYASYLKKIAGDNIIFLGFVEGGVLQGLYDKAYLFVLPSEIEGLPVSLLEAMSYGKCVLLSDIAECREVAGDCGVYFKSGEYIDLKDKLEYLLKNPGVVSKMGSRCKKRVSEQYSWDNITEGMKGIYSSF